MSGKLTLALCAATAVAVVGLSSTARAADPDFCRDYARAAADQYRQATAHHRCMDQIDNYARWSPDWRHHYNWCLGVSRDQAWGERNARRDILNECARHWDDGDRYDHYDRYDHHDERRSVRLS